MEEVECAECGNRYDSATQPFCTRCGNVGSRGVTGPVSAARFDPRRRRAQVGGLVLIVTAGLMLALYGVVLATAGTLVAEQSTTILQDQAGGDLIVELAGPNGSIAGATVQVMQRNGTLLVNGTTDANGSARFDDLPHAAVNMTVTWENQTWHREVLVIGGDSITVAIDTATSPSRGSVGTDALVGPVRVMLGFFSLVSLFVVLGGVSAMRLRHRGVAVGAAIVGLLPILILAVAVPNIGTLLLLLTMTLALMFIWGGRQHFR